MEVLVYIFPSCLKRGDGKFSLEKVQMLKGLSMKIGTKPIIFWIGHKDQQELNSLLSQVRLDVVKILPSNKPDEEDTLTVQRRYLNKCLKGVKSFYVISELKSSDKRFLTTKELTQDICDIIKGDHSNQNKVFFYSKDIKKMGGRQTVKNVTRRFTPSYINKNSDLIAAPDVSLEEGR